MGLEDIILSEINQTQKNLNIIFKILNAAAVLLQYLLQSRVFVFAPPPLLQEGNAANFSLLLKK